jgi:hypothetical protein
MSRKRKHKRDDSFIFEPKHAPLLSRTQFYLRLARTAAIAAGVVLASLFLGAIGFHSTENLSWLDSTLNASMLLSGMGPLDHPQSTPGKLFATFYALFSGVVFLTVAALLFAPIFHRLIHRFHLELDEADSRAER